VQGRVRRRLRAAAGDRGQVDSDIPPFRASAPEREQAEVPKRVEEHDDDGNAPDDDRDNADGHTRDAGNFQPLEEGDKQANADNTGDGQVYG